MPIWNPRNRQELLGSHYYIHAFWNRTRKGKKIKGWNRAKIIRFHDHYVVIFRKYGYKHNSPLRNSINKAKEGGK